jgi:hypothetical protein
MAGTAAQQFQQSQKTLRHFINGLSLIQAFPC